MTQKIAFSASFFNCPDVRAILETCNKIYTTNDYAVGSLIGRLPIEFKSGQEIEEMRKSHPVEHSVTFPDLHRAFYKWIAHKASDDEIQCWVSYFSDSQSIKTVDQIRQQAQEFCKVRYPENIPV